MLGKLVGNRIRAGRHMTPSGAERYRRYINSLMENFIFCSRRHRPLYIACRRQSDVLAPMTTLSQCEYAIQRKFTQREREFIARASELSRMPYCRFHVRGGGSIANEVLLAAA